MHETELSVGVLAAQLGVALHGSPPVGAHIDHCDAIEDALIVLGMRVERFDNEPLIGMCHAHLSPAHATRAGTESDSEQLLDEAVGRFATRARFSTADSWQRREIAG